MAAIALVATAAAATAQEQARAPEPHAASASEARRKQWIHIRDVNLHLTDQVVLRVRTLHGEVVRTNPAHAATLDDPNSFGIRVTAATVALTGADLAALLNSMVFAYPGAPLRDLRIRTDGSELVQTGILHKGVDLTFRMRASLSITPDGRIRIHPSDVRVLGLNGQKLLHLVGLHLDNMLDVSRARGVSVHGDDLFLTPAAFLPPPAIDGRLASIRIEGDVVVQEFARQSDDSLFGVYVREDTSDAHYIYFRGGELRFGKLLMTDTDLRIVGTDRASFDMSLPHYLRQLVAGRSQTRPNLGLIVYMPNLSAVLAGDSGHSTGPTTHAKKEK